MVYGTTADMTPVINRDEQTRSAFLIRVYQHLALAVAAFMAFTTGLFVTGLAERIYTFVTDSGGMMWLLILGIFMAANTISGKAAANITNPGAQYAGLFGMAATYSLLFSPSLYYAFTVRGAGTVASAAFVTAVGFAGLTAVAMLTKSDLSFLRPIVMFVGVMAIVAIVGSLLFGFSLGLWFSVAMVALAGAAILYQTQEIVRRFPAWAHVAAAVSLFGSLMTMFFYILRIFSNR